MENQKSFTREEVIENLKGAIELQELQTKLQELRGRFYAAQYQELAATLQLEHLKAGPEESPEQEEARKDFEQMKETDKINIKK